MQYWLEPKIILHSKLMYDSYSHWLGKPLITGIDDAQSLAEALYRAPFVLVSHDTDFDPKFNYANLQAQDLWQLGWPEFVGRPSRTSAETAEQQQRAQALNVAADAGFTTGYSGIRISARGQRFLILDGVIWNIVDTAGHCVGQAASFPKWEFV
ncbi:hypothetical protein TI04_04790 [Achromatium sp. WMS2]|nr:hypothetical protein TI04_04790 [Achromatium sp. WMS2]